MGNNNMANQATSPQITVGGKSDIVSLTVRSFSSQTENIMEMYDGSNNIVAAFTSDGSAYYNSVASLNSAWGIDAVGAAIFGSLILDSVLQTNHIIGNSVAPTIAAGAGAGTGPTIVISGKDLAGQISLTTGTLPTGTGAVICTVTFGTAFSSAPFVNFSPANAVTAALGGATGVFVTSTTTTFALDSGTTALTASTAYKWTYHVIG